MSAIKKLVKDWETNAKTRLAPDELRLRLPIHDAARIAALQEMYPQRGESEIIIDLITAALDELEGLLPYKEGTKIIARDEVGDPIYEDAGPSRQLFELTRKHLRRLEAKSGQPVDPAAS